MVQSSFLTPTLHFCNPIILQKFLSWPKTKEHKVLFLQLHTLLATLVQVIGISFQSILREEVNQRRLTILGITLLISPHQSGCPANRGIKFVTK